MTARAQIIAVAASDLDYYWPYVASFIESALEHTDGTSLESIQSDIANHDRQLWVIKDQNQYIAAVVTRIQIYPTGKIGEITEAGGKDHHKWDHFVDVAEAWFRSENCSEMSIIGRAGWERLYRDRGFRLHCVELRRDLGDGVKERREDNPNKIG